MWSLIAVSKVTSVKVASAKQLGHWVLGTYVYLDGHIGYLFSVLQSCSTRQIMTHKNSENFKIRDSNVVSKTVTDTNMILITVTCLCRSRDKRLTSTELVDHLVAFHMYSIEKLVASCCFG